MVEVAFRLQSTPGQQRVGNADRCGISELHSDVKFIIAFQKAPVNDVEDVPLVFHPILADKLGRDTFKLFRQVIFRRRSKPLGERLGHRRLMLRAKLPQERVAGIFPQAGVGNIKHIPKSGLFAGIVYQGDALGAAPHIPAHGVVPEVIFRTGRCVRALGEDHKLLVEGVLIQPGGGGEKCCPPLPAIRQVGGGVAGHRRIKFQVTHHRHCRRCQNPGTVPARQMLHRSWRTALKEQSR